MLTISFLLAFFDMLGTGTLTFSQIDFKMEGSRIEWWTIMQRTMQADLPCPAKSVASRIKIDVNELEICVAVY